MVWISAIHSGKLPFDIQSKEIKALIDNEKTKVESAIVTKTAQIISNFTLDMEVEVELHKSDRSVRHPKELGDYDVLAYLKDFNILLNVECKDILPAFCMKDDSRIRRKFFGDGNTDDRGYLGKVENRAAYLTKNIHSILKIFGWENISGNEPTVISIFVSRYSYWWTRFPSLETDVKFTTLNMLREFLEKLS